MLMDVENVLDERIDPYELERFRDDYERGIKTGAPTVAATFCYAHGLIKSTKQDVNEGIRLLEDLLRKEPDEMPKRDYVYYLAIANARLKDYDRALAYLDVLLAVETHNRQARELKEIIEKKMKREGLLGAAVIGGGAVLVGGLLAAVFAAARR
ncbi:unnamed protein product, partial [Mesorhabditis belari]|uniref:Mitochondrial fission 1 protein n=1 Tax=Mesorhabditis belari TaxID=2138241 RepID=A0AAF3F3B2_9BILA